MKTAEQYAHYWIIENIWSSLDYNELVDSFQSALNAPMELTDDKPEEDGDYWYKHPRDELILIHVCALIAYHNDYPVGRIDYMEGRFSHMIKPPEGGESDENNDTTTD